MHAHWLDIQVRRRLICPRSCSIAHHPRYPLSNADTCHSSCQQFLCCMRQPGSAQLYPESTLDRPLGYVPSLLEISDDRTSLRSPPSRPQSLCCLGQMQRWSFGISQPCDFSSVGHPPNTCRSAGVRRHITAFSNTHKCGHRMLQLGKECSSPRFLDRRWEHCVNSKSNVSNLNSSRLPLLHTLMNCSHRMSAAPNRTTLTL